MDLAQMESGKFQYNLMHFQLQDLLLECIALIDDQADSKKMKILLEIDRDVPDLIF